MRDQLYDEGFSKAREPRSRQNVVVRCILLFACPAGDVLCLDLVARTLTTTVTHRRTRFTWGECYPFLRGRLGERSRCTIASSNQLHHVLYLLLISAMRYRQFLSCREPCSCDVDCSLLPIFHRIEAYERMSTAVACERETCRQLALGGVCINNAARGSIGSRRGQLCWIPVGKAKVQKSRKPRRRICHF